MRFSFGFNFKRKAGSVSQRKAAAAGEGSLAGLIALHGGAAATWSGHSFVQLAREGYMRNPVAHRCVRLIAEAAAQPPLLLHDGNREFDSHPLLDLIRRPNPHQAGGAFFETLYGHLMLSGNAFIEAVAIDGEPRELHLLRPDQVTIRTDQRGWPVAYEHEAGGTRRRIAAAGGAEGPGVLHLKLFHPLDDQAGFAPLGAAAMALDLHNAAAIWNKALLDNSARPSGALVYQPKEGGNLSEDQYERLKSELEDGYSGARRAGRPMLLEGGLDWKAMALSPREMDFVEARHAAARDIALAFGVPPMLLGIPGRPDLRQLPGSQPGLLSPDRAAAGGPHGRRADRLAAAGLW